MKKYLLAALVVLLVALDWAALHDILKEQENTTAEYVMLFIFGGIFLTLIFVWASNRIKKANAL